MQPDSSDLTSLNILHEINVHATSTDNNAEYP